MNDDSLSFIDASANPFDDEESNESLGDRVENETVRKDVELMNIVRAIAILVILTITTVSAEAVFIVSRSAEEKSFTTAYDKVAQKLFETFKF